MLKDQKELLSVFNAHSVDYLVVGGHAAIAYGVARLTKDLDIWIRPSESNSINVFRALAEFGAPLQGMSAANFVDHPNDVLQLGVAPNRIDILQSISARNFGLLQNKQFVGRLRDLADVDELRKMRKLS